eukprot:4057071-Amphidinium_carterae.1
MHARSTCTTLKQERTVSNNFVDALISLVDSLLHSVWQLSTDRVTTGTLSTQKQFQLCVRE